MDLVRTRTGTMTATDTERLPVNSTTERFFRARPESVFPYLLEAASSGFKVRPSNGRPLTVILRKRPRVLTWGEELYAEAIPAVGGCTVRVQDSPGVKIQPSGRNLKYVDRLFESLTASLCEGQPYS
jgi:hypothetical protein